MKIGEYVKVDKEGCFNISPSSLHAWFENSQVWHINQVMKKGTFTGNVFTQFGNICHGVAEAYAIGDTLTQQDVDDYIESQDMSWEDAGYIKANWQNAKDKILEFMKTRPTPDEVEFQVLFEPIDGYTLGGTVDARTGVKITDYKSCSKIPKEISKSHKYQLMSYALALQGKGVKVTEIEVVYIKRPDMIGKISEKTGKVIGIRETVIECRNEPITDELIAEVKLELKTLIRCHEVTTNDDKFNELTREELVGLIYRTNPLSYITE